MELDTVSSRALVWWWLISTMLGLLILNMLIWVVVASRLLLLHRELRAVAEAALRAREDAFEARQLLSVWARTWADPVVKAELLSVLRAHQGGSL